MKHKPKKHQLTNSAPESLEIQELLELAQELDLRRKKEKKSFRHSMFPGNLTQ
jgi:hypothetical protein